MTTWAEVPKPVRGATTDGFITDGDRDGFEAREHTDGFFVSDGTWDPVIVASIGPFLDGALTDTGESGAYTDTGEGGSYADAGGVWTLIASPTYDDLADGALTDSGIDGAYTDTGDLGAETSTALFWTMMEVT